MTIYSWLIVFCWLVLLFYWGVAAFRAKKTISFRWKHLGIQPVVIFTLLVLLLIATEEKFFGIFKDLVAIFDLVPRGLVLGLGDVLCVGGISIAVWARAHLGKNWAMPRVIKENQELVMTGPYEYIRHPIYTGVILALLGSGLVAGASWFIFALVVSAYFIYSAFVEERQMQETFPVSYPAYKKRTKMLIPYVI